MLYLHVALLSLSRNSKSNKIYLQDFEKLSEAEQEWCYRCRPKIYYWLPLRHRFSSVGVLNDFHLRYICILCRWCGLSLEAFLQFDIRLRHWAEISPNSGDFSQKCCLLSLLPIPATAALRLRLTAHHSLVWGNEEFEAELTPYNPYIEQETDLKC